MANLVRDPETGAYSFRDPSTTVINQVTGQTATGLIPANQTQTSTPAVFSTDQGIKTVQEKQKVLSEIAPPPTSAPKPTEVKQPEPLKDQTQSIFKNPTTGQEYIFNSTDIQNQANIDFIKQQGLTFAEGNVPAWLAGGTSTSDYDKAVQEVDGMMGDLDSLIEKYGITDASLARTVGSIKGQYDARKRDMERINASRTGALASRGFRSGSSQYSADFGGVVSEEERQGVARISELDAQMNNEILAAQDAQRRANWTVFSKAVDAAEKRRSELATALKDYNSKVIEENNKIREKAIRVTRDNAVNDLLLQGVTDPSQMLDFLNFDEQGNQIGDFTADEVKKTLDNLYKSTGVGKGPLGLTHDETINLYGAGFNQEDIQLLEEYINKNGYDNKLISSLTPQQKTILDGILLPKKPATGVGNTLTIAEAKALGVPISLIGRSQDQIISDLGSREPPQWFIDSQEAETSQDLLPDVVRERWNEFRNTLQQVGSAGGDSFSGLPAPVE